MHVREVFPDCPVSLNVQNVYMNDAKEKFADKALIWRSIKMKLVDYDTIYTPNKRIKAVAIINSSLTLLTDITHAWGLFGLDVPAQRN